jgi:PPK2 family polyphosphate:nucleotide phosphotransferase
MSERPSPSAVREAVQVRPAAAARFRLADAPTRDETLFPDKADAERSLAEDAPAIDALQDAMFAAKCGALLVVLQGMDTSGKDGVVRSVFSAAGPLGVRVHPFGRPTEHELAHDYLWRVHAVVPQMGHIGVFNRSHYEDVLAVKVRALRPANEIERRYDQINAFEKMLTENCVRILKVMLHISKTEQGERLQERLDEPRKRWKFNAGDLEDRKRWDEFQAAYETMLRRCSTEWAPWHVVPSDSRARRNAIVARLVRGELENLNPQYPQPAWKPSDFRID